VKSKGEMVAQPHGGRIKRGGSGRKPTRAEVARREAGNDLRLAERLLRVALDVEAAKVVEISRGRMRIKEGEKLDVVQLSAIVTALVRIAGDRPKAKREMRTHFGVLRAGETEAVKAVGEEP
jgi:hypothetical protein